MNWHKRNSHDFVEGTRNLTLEEIGAYSLILDFIYERDGDFPDDMQFLSHVLHCDVRVAKRLLASLVKHGKLFQRKGQIHNARADREIAKFKARIRRAKKDAPIDVVGDADGDATTSFEKGQQNQRPKKQNLELKKEEEEIESLSRRRERATTLPFTPALRAKVFDEWSFVSTDGSVSFSAEEMRELADLYPNLGDVRAMVRGACRSFIADVEPKERVKALRNWLTKRNDEAARKKRDRADDDGWRGQAVRP